MVIDTGFRGQKVKILNNHFIDYLGCEYEEEELDFHKDAKNYCYTCHRSFRLDEIEKHNIIKGHKIFKPVRNRISFNLNINKENFRLEISNVNKYNLQPCRVRLYPLNKINKNWTGCIVNRKYAFNSKLKNIKDIKKIKVKVNNLPLTEIKPIIKNKKYE